MNVVDSSAWVEFFAGGPNAAEYLDAIADLEHLVVPVVVLYEVFKRLLLDAGEEVALDRAAHLRQGIVVPVDDSLALSAAQLSITHRLPMADGLILATARAHGATLWTQDAHFEGLPDVRFFPKAGT